MTDIVPKDPKQRLIESIRGWIHMDNLLENHTAQASNARALRSKHEKDAIDTMKQMRLDKSVIQVSGATLSIQRKSAPAVLSWGYLEKEIAAWATQSGVSASQSLSLIRWLQEHREIKHTESLKKTGLKTPELQ
jgi:hypothetical protein